MGSSVIYHILESSRIRHKGSKITQRLKMASKAILLFLLIAGVFAVDLKADAEFDQDLVESEDVDVVARNMNEDLQLLEEEVMFELQTWCNDKDPDDAVCQNLE